MAYGLITFYDHITFMVIVVISILTHQSHINYDKSSLSVTHQGRISKVNTNADSVSKWVGESLTSLLKRLVSHNTL